MEIINLSKEQMIEWVTHEDSWMNVETLDTLYANSNVLNGYTFQATKILTPEEAETPNQTIIEICKSLPICLKETFCVLVIFEETHTFNPTSRYRFKHNLSNFLNKTTLLRRLHLKKPKATADKVTLCFLGVPVTESSVNELHSHELVSPCAKEQVRQKRLLSLYK